MFTNTVYYLVKPFLPWWLRVALRRKRANARRASFADTWPIDDKAGAKPPGWPGWPQGKRFAFVLTHDVEGKKGLSRVERLMEMEMRCGLRSSFNFVPEGEYRLPDSLRQSLDRAGFEIGVHGLEHDGKLYASKRSFGRKVNRIKKYLEEWGASGFRSPLMQHKLAWLHELGVEYDASTFDTDPFEPQPDGMRTIFPFWVRGPEGTGYVELPYTLPQDFTLFTVLRETNIDIWKQKLDWIAERGGMVLLNTHPDYMAFGGEEPARDEFPVSQYAELLSYVRRRYEGEFWSSLPRDVARFYCASLPIPARNSRRKVCMLAYTTYEHDNRVRRYAEALASRGDLVDVLAVSGGNDPPVETIRGVTVYRIQHRPGKERWKLTYAWRWLLFLVKSSAMLAHRHIRNRYDLIHVHNMPDFLVFAAWYPKVAGAKVILDIHDIVPELYASKFDVKIDSPSVRLLKHIERASTALADHVIVSNHLWHAKLIARCVTPEKCSVFLNHVDPAIFYRRPRTRGDGKYVILFPGSFLWHQGLDIAIRALVRVKARVPNAELHLYGGGGGVDSERRLACLADQLGLDGSVRFCGSVALDRIADVIANADLGVVPKRADSFGNEAYSTKIMEFMSQGVPVVVSRTKIDTFYFREDVVQFFTSGDSEAMADAMLEVMENQALRESLIERGLEYVCLNNWGLRKADYLDLVDSLSTQAFERSDAPRMLEEVPRSK